MMSSLGWKELEGCEGNPWVNDMSSFFFFACWRIFFARAPWCKEKTS